MKPYVILALPRSRTFWLSQYLTYTPLDGGEPYFCGHESLLGVQEPGDVDRWLSMPRWGTAETAAAPFWRLLTKAKIVLIRRTVQESLQSMLRLPIVFDKDKLAQQLWYLDRKLD